MSFYLCYSFIKHDGYNKLLKNYTKWQNLNKLVSYNHDSAIMIRLVSLSIILKSYYLSFIQIINNSVIKLDKNTYEVSYIVNEKLYKMIVSHSKGPPIILCILNENEDNITDEITPYFGPNNDWHKRKFTPKFFKNNTLKFELSSGEIKIFKNLEIIEL
jgi:hypothetical protein